MGWHKPEPPLVWRAIATYLAHAFDGSPDAAAHGAPARTPAAVRLRLESLRATAPADFFASPVFECDAAAHPTKFSLRLGNRTYPHMKLVVDRAPDGRGHLFRADTHDGHCRPAPGSRDYPAFCKLMDVNRDLAARIEAAWEAEGIPTFKSFLRDDLARRRAQQEP
ncbi:MAG: hypothetical protein AVDCRST_MAG64-4396 [uncultured Phycisphaerae bacterium]|uniref:Uncharacterized protein n=1 Tax=uncultured Phycisphaerae bacterium TaxID=904963 RepID=A0A6J4QG89_9BACT|nr:MAG: hypothetical protein AVDCRST_MAG64-4396 [uncultured Phycisphaerae bacterium]